MTTEKHHYQSDHFRQTKAELKAAYADLVAEIREHYRDSDRRAARDLHLTRCFLRNRTYRQVEQKTHEPYTGEPHLYGCATDGEFDAWLTGETINLQQIREGAVAVVEDAA